MTTKMPPAPVTELGYATAYSSSWWLSAEQEQTPELRWPLSIFVYDRMARQDAQVQSVLRAVTLPVRRTPWSIEQGPASEEVTRFVADNLGLPVSGKPAAPSPRTRDRFSWSKHLTQALLMIRYGHMFFEQVYRIGDDGRAYLRKLAPRMPQTLMAINVDRDGGLASIQQYGTLDGSAQDVTIPVSRLVGYIHEQEGGNWLGQSLLRPAYKHWLLKDRLIRVQAQTIERNGMGVPVYTADPEEADLEPGKKLAQGFRSGENSGASIASGAKLELKGVTGTLPNAQTAIDYHDQQIGRSVLAHFLNLGTQTGSWALGSTFADFFSMSLQTLAQQVGDITQQHVVEDLVDINFGPDEPAPRLTFQEIGSRHAVTAEAIALLVNSGVLLREPALERYIRETYGIPDKEPLPGQEPPPAAPAPSTTPAPTGTGEGADS